MREHRMQVVPRPFQDGIYLPAKSQGPAGQGSDIYLCGECGIILLRNVSPQLPSDCAITCPNCGAWNVSGTDAEAADEMPGIGNDHQILNAR